MYDLGRILSEQSWWRVALFTTAPRIGIRVDPPIVGHPWAPQPPPRRSREGEGDEGVDRVLGRTAGARVSSAKGRADMGVMAHTGNMDCDNVVRNISAARFLALAQA